MSLLNDALKAAEQRQNRPQISRAYTGQASVPPQSRAWLPWVLLLLVLMMVGAGAAWWWLQGASNTTDRAEPVAQESSPQRSGPEPKPDTLPEVEPVVRQPEPVHEPVQPIAELVEAEPEPTTEPEPEPEAEPETADEPEPPGDRASVKQTRQTPEAIDRQTARELERLLAIGRATEAEQQLTELAQNQPAPRSREAFAREMLIQQMPGRALEWLPERLTREHASLRLLRARAQLEQGSLQTAIATLESRVPPVDASPEYRVTLATLLQQAGQAEESAGHWSELIAFDNDQPTWWLGLAMALEEGGRTNSAIRAYTQAATMPELADNLAEFAQQRLQALQAGQ
ncbi:MSHA biogenesis protein MshN [Marinobacter persicus]|uniref:MSHA biogenesis protein MshN n=1 Tax=Marinobacter persicus TaxID=930118 RepID=A0A1I3XBJ7_9GAMM|nr:hypothetical protein [Marinobacter persicus]GHD49008.1 hypothetical protein GCM10008110_18460 [Marinobacter persicus]SFK16948.1 MSHA biogenesis protein MshN [Marinobacter persicus]